MRLLVTRPPGGLVPVPREWLLSVTTVPLCVSVPTRSPRFSCTMTLDIVMLCMMTLVGRMP
jgi:hypothetical protein